MIPSVSDVAPPVPPLPWRRTTHRLAVPPTCVSPGGAVADSGIAPVVPADDGTSESEPQPASASTAKPTRALRRRAILPAIRAG